MEIIFGNYSNLTPSQMINFRVSQIERDIAGEKSKSDTLLMNFGSLIRLNTLWKKEKLFVMCYFFFSLSVF